MTTFNREDSLDLPVLAAAPEAPEAGRKKLYVGDDGKFYAIDGQGNVMALQAASGASQLSAPVEFLAIDEGPAPTNTFQTADVSMYGSGQYAIVNFQANDYGNTGYRFMTRPNDTWPLTCQWEIAVPATGQEISGTALIALDNGTFEYKSVGVGTAQVGVFLRLVGFLA